MTKSWLGIDENEKKLTRNGMMFGGIKEYTNNTGFVIVFLNKKHQDNIQTKSFRQQNNNHLLKVEE